jgi:hypothetical protein
MNEQHIYTHSEPTTPKVNLSVEKNTKGYNWSVTVVGAASVEEALLLLAEAQAVMTAQFGAPAA